MGKNNYLSTKFVFGQLISLVDNSMIEKAVQIRDSDRYLKHFKCQNDLFSMAFCCSAEDYQSILDDVAPLDILIKKYQPQSLKEDIYFMKEFILWGLVEYDKLSKDRFENGYQFKDTLGSFIDKL